mmetsp:Transcript_12489/g.29824  ORF Transcript_12489/g.29824 Transcript_12489/m.29824 type:complete len:400 (-) Transcript_12489:94-1293(-)
MLFVIGQRHLFCGHPAHGSRHYLTPFQHTRTVGSLRRVCLPLRLPVRFSLLDALLAIIIAALLARCCYPEQRADVLVHGVAAHLAELFIERPQLHQPLHDRVLRDAPALALHGQVIAEVQVVTQQHLRPQLDQLPTLVCDKGRVSSDGVHGWQEGRLQEVNLVLEVGEQADHLGVLLPHQPPLLGHRKARHVLADALHGQTSTQVHPRRKSLKLVLDRLCEVLLLGFIWELPAGHLLGEKVQLARPDVQDLTHLGGPLLLDEPGLLQSTRLVTLLVGLVDAFVIQPLVVEIACLAAPGCAGSRPAVVFILFLVFTLVKRIVAGKLRLSFSLGELPEFAGVLVFILLCYQAHQGIHRVGVLIFSGVLRMSVIVDLQALLRCRLTPLVVRVHLSKSVLLDA